MPNEPSQFPELQPAASATSHAQSRPAPLADVIGQHHLLGTGVPSRAAFESGRLRSMILWGQLGMGKTTLARLMVHAFEAQFIAISAVLGGVNNIREAVDRASAAVLAGRRSVEFVDDVQRINKAVNSYINQQLMNALMRFLVLPHCSSVGVRHG